jgi:hypothetical protein
MAITASVYTRDPQLPQLAYLRIRAPRLGRHAPLGQPILTLGAEWSPFGRVLPPARESREDRAMSEGAAVVIYQVGPQWEQDVPLLKQDHALGHIRFIRQLLGEGAARSAGPFCRLDQHPADQNVGVIIFDVPPDRAKELVSDDPAVRNGLLEPQVYPFYPA